MKRPHPAPFADAARILLAGSSISDIDTALGLIGVQRTERADGVEDELSTTDVQTDGESIDEVLMEAIAPEILEGDEDAAEEDKQPDQDEARIAKEILKSGWIPWQNELPSKRRPGAATRLPSNVERSMVSYLLPFDKRSDQDRADQPKYDYSTIENRVQHVLKPKTTPDAEAWRVARRVFDSGPRRDILAGLDLRACADKIARAEAIERLPRARRQAKRLDSVQLLVERDLARRVHSADIKKLLKSMQSIGIPHIDRTMKIQQRDSEWFCGTGPPWTYRPFLACEHPTWFIILAGGDAADQQNLARWKELLNSMYHQHTVTIVWVGDRLPAKLPSMGRAWVSYRK
ncbi:hypothetical protein [Stieleria varia]|uniref:Uncharacterized protein n=1 Tax=Stieleria varia TaxID=2528005 RepID=A0A5C6AZ34_9BACT|nr:hypothetical protein [Stieleria varia]TWU04737.1 hypothetical protein Pla52n_27800 [Stieleria varia]